MPGHTVILCICRPIMKLRGNGTLISDDDCSIFAERTNSASPIQRASKHVWARKSLSPVLMWNKKSLVRTGNVDISFHVYALLHRTAYVLMAKARCLLGLLLSIHVCVQVHCNWIHLGWSWVIICECLEFYNLSILCGITLDLHAHLCSFWSGPQHPLLPFPLQG